uniref:4-alpha-glucanotransferase n=1 Tax=Rodentolepis nana TaxID=102285 RepID=A0A0R3TIV5_RODNA
LMPVTVCTNSAMPERPIWAWSKLHARDCLYQFGYVIDEDIEKSAGCDSFLWNAAWDSSLWKTCL